MPINLSPGGIRLRAHSRREQIVALDEVGVERQEEEERTEGMREGE